MTNGWISGYVKSVKLKEFFMKKCLLAIVLVVTCFNLYAVECSKIQKDTVKEAVAFEFGLAVDQMTGANEILRYECSIDRYASGIQVKAIFNLGYCVFVMNSDNQITTLIGCPPY